VVVEADASGVHGDRRIDVGDNEGRSEPADELGSGRDRAVTQAEFWYSALSDQFGRNIHSIPPPAAKPVRPLLPMFAAEKPNVSVMAKPSRTPA